MIISIFTYIYMYMYLYPGESHVEGDSTGLRSGSEKDYF